MAGKRKISLVLADVDGTLVTEEKVLTERAQNAVNALQSDGIRFAITSGRPPLGMAMLFDALKLDTPIAGLKDWKPRATARDIRSSTSDR
jgi:hydroxymethylpyrimidine pyrophosphatase-like HAD family hydrolase